jgi:hypothetical protein
VPNFPNWGHMDCVKLRISSTISTNLAEFVLSRDATNREVWLALKEPFLATRILMPSTLMPSSGKSAKATCPSQGTVSASRTWRTR